MDTTLERPTEMVRSARTASSTAQSRWARRPVRERLRVIRDLRHLIAENGAALAARASAVKNRPLAEKIVSEVLPLADACRWLERSAARVLAPRACGARGRPLWLQGASFEVQRQPFGTVLVIGPVNYPLFLPAVHTLHALVAGNAVLLKPAPGTREVALMFARLAAEAGLEQGLLEVLPDSTEAAVDAIHQGVGKVVFTGSVENGRGVLTQLAGTNIPAIMELSGNDPVIVLADADLDLVLRALLFGTRLNGGDTCIAPRWIIAVNEVSEALTSKLEDLAAGEQSELVCFTVRDEAAALELVNAADLALGASIFSRDIVKARALAARFKTGFVVINDLIVPTADPRMPFGGVKASGFGTTRGDEGLLEMTFPHVVAVRAGGVRAHFEEPLPEDAHLIAAYIRVAHGRWSISALRDLVGALIRRSKIKKSLP